MGWMVTGLFVTGLFVTGIFVTGMMPSTFAGQNHPTHVSRGDVRFNPDTQSLEFAVCLYEEDVRTLLMRSQNGVANLDDHQTCDPLLKEYLVNNFWVATVNKQECPVTWYGYQQEKEGVWIYFEVAVGKTPENLVVGNRMLMEVQPGNVADFRFQWGDRKATLLFNSQTAARKLKWQEPPEPTDGRRSLSFSISETVRSGHASPAIIPSYDAPPRPFGS